MIKTVLSKYVGLILAFIVFLIYISNAFYDYKTDLAKRGYRRIATSADIIPNTFLPLAIMKNHSFSFDGLSYNIRSIDNSFKNPYFFIKVGGSYYSSYPVFTGIIALPFYAIPIALTKLPNLNYFESILKVFLIGRITASALTATSAFFMYQVFKKLDEGKKYLPIIFTVFYALGTNSWSISSRALWQHTASQLLFSILLYILLNKIDNFRHTGIAGLIAGFAIISRPTNIFIVGLIGLYILFKSFKKSLVFVLALLPSLIFMLIYNTLIFGGPLNQGYSARNDLNWNTPLNVSIPGYLFSPARSFLFISPPLLLAFVTIAAVWLSRNKNEKAKMYTFIGIGLILSIFVYCKWYAWEGANGFGYRMLTDFIPFIALLAYEQLLKLNSAGKAVVFILIIYSILVQANAVFYLKSRCNAVNNWNFKCLPFSKLTYN